MLWKRMEARKHGLRKGRIEMPESLAELSCLRFSELLASKAAAPGGGGAAALMGALAAGLGNMATNLTVGKKKYLKLIDEDAAAFEPLAAAYSMDRSDPCFAQRFRTVTLGACRVPFTMMECCAELIVLLEELLEKCSVLLLSDVGCAALAAAAALQAAAMNVFVNTRSLPEDSEAGELEEQAAGLLREYLPRSEKVSDAVMRHLRTAK